MNNKKSYGAVHGLKILENFYGHWEYKINNVVMLFLGSIAFEKLFNIDRSHSNKQ